MSIRINLVALVALVVICWLHFGAENVHGAGTIERPRLRYTRSDAHARSMMHNHLSRKVFDRACAASKDTIDEIIACLTSNQALLKAVKEETAKSCYREAFGLDFDPKDVTKHKELICNNRDKFETMTTCVYKKTADVLDAKEMEKMAEAMVDVGMCIINALDG